MEVGSRDKYLNGPFVMKATIALLGVLLLSGCKIGGPETGEGDPKYPWWR
jgi:hypothetical protein